VSIPPGFPMDMTRWPGKIWDIAGGRGGARSPGASPRRHPPQARQPGPHRHSSHRHSRGPLRPAPR
jgi:hypothetical protein